MNKIQFILINLIFSMLSLNVHAEDWVYTTRPGDSLWGISQQYLKGVEYWPKLQKHNKLGNPKLLPPGIRLSIPVDWLKNQPTPAVVIAVNGNAFVMKSSDKERIRITEGMKIHIQNEVKTEEHSRVVLRFGDDSTLIIQQNSSVKMNILTAHGANGMVDTRIRLHQGRVESKIVPFKNKRSRYEITTPAAVASVRGTTFTVSMSSDLKTMHSEVVEGEIAVASQGVTQKVPAGFGLSVEKGKPPSEPLALLSAPDLQALPKTFHTMPIKISWPSVNGAVKYHVEIAPNAQFFTTFLDEHVIEPEIKWRTKELGEYALRVKGVSEKGSSGLSAIHEFSIVPSFPAPILMAPKNNAQVAKQNLAFFWVAHSDAKRFMLQVSSNQKFTNNVVEVRGSQQHYTMRKRLAPGRYYWRVANEYEGGVVGEFGQVFQFEIHVQK